jgi:hypothetical protein
MDDKLRASRYDTIFGVGGIGLRWIACKMTKTGGSVPEVIVDWHDDITNDESYDLFRDYVTQHLYQSCVDN